MLIFAILGVNFFKGAYYSCQLDLEDLLPRVDTLRDCYDAGGIWVKYGANFDNVLIASVTLFEMMTTEGWVDTMSRGIDATGIEKQPKENHRQYMAIYFVIFMILGAFLIINLFTAVITDNFNKLKEQSEIGAGSSVTDLQRQWVNIQNICLKTDMIKREHLPDSPWRRKIFYLVMNPWFDMLIIFIIVLNTIVVAMEYARMSDTYAQVLIGFSIFFIVLYNIEMTLKLIGLGKQYFTHDSWNIFDFF